ncbi:hypothetical protein HOC35_03215 [Candidatus Woesearchaeota archaeon]|jgi:hypothetical protein|nr:hypothetical protein [Candidatus Woesearchaeota archaeon]
MHIGIQGKVSFIIDTDERLREELKYVNQVLAGYMPQLDVLSSFRPEESWFLRKPEGTHGIAHEARVLVFAELLGRLYQTEKGLGSIDLDVLRRAASTHDIRRSSDLVDIGHGERAASFYLDNLIANGYVNDNGIDSEKVAYVNSWHVPDDHHAPHMTSELMLFKDADGLDRVRIEHNGQGMDMSYARFEQTSHFVATAAYLFKISNAIMFSGVDQFDAVMQAAGMLGLIENDYAKSLINYSTTNVTE